MAVSWTSASSDEPSVTTSVVVVANLEDGGSMTEGPYRLECLEPNVKGRRTLRG